MRELLWLGAALLALWCAYLWWGLLVPFLAAFALAYVAEPLVRALQRRARVPRVVTALALLLVLIAAATVFAIWLLPSLVEQIASLYARLPIYWQTLQQGWTDFEASLTTQPAESGTTLDDVKPATVVRHAFGGVGPFFGLLGQAVGTAGYLLVAAILIPVLFVFFTTYYERFTGLQRYLPASRRERIRGLLQGIDAAFSGYVRGQLVVAVFTTIGFSIGFYLVSVPYWFVAALIGGILSVIPYGQCTGWVLAIVFKFAEAQTGAVEFTFLGGVLAPSLVYLVTQSMESWVITPLAQGQATNLHPVVVLVVLIIGGTLAGIIGLILAVPVTASIRLLVNELVLPRWRHWADSR